MRLSRQDQWKNSWEVQILVRKSSRNQGVSQRRAGRAGANKNTTLISFKEKDIKQRWLITSEGCPTCEQLKHDLKKEIEKGIVKCTDVGDDVGFAIIQALGIDAVPIFIVELKDGFPVRYLIDE